MKAGSCASMFTHRVTVGLGRGALLLVIIQLVVHVSYISRGSFFAIYMNCEKEICTLTPAVSFLRLWESVRAVVLGVQSLDRLINDSN